MENRLDNTNEADKSLVEGYVTDMDNKFDNTYKVDKTKFMYMFTHPMKNNKKIYIYNAILIFLLIVLCLFSKLYTIWGGTVEMVLIIGWTFFCAYMIFFYRRSFGQKQYTAISKAYGTDSWDVTTKFEDKIYITEKERTVEIEYGDVDEIIVKGDFIGILQGNEKGVRLDINGFTDCSVEEFMEFIMDKCEKAQVTR